MEEITSGKEVTFARIGGIQHCVTCMDVVSDAVQAYVNGSPARLASLCQPCVDKIAAFTIGKLEPRKKTIPPAGPAAGPAAA